MDPGTAVAIVIGVFGILGLLFGLPALRRGSMRATLEVQASQIRALESALEFDRKLCDEKLSTQGAEMGRLRGRIDQLNESFVNRIAEESASAVVGRVQQYLESLSP